MKEFLRHHKDGTVSVWGTVKNLGGPYSEQEILGHIFLSN